LILYNLISKVKIFEADDFCNKIFKALHNFREELIFKDKIFEARQASLKFSPSKI